MDTPIGAAEHYGPAALRHEFECGTDGPRVIVVGVDGSPTSEHAAAYAAGLARRQRCRLVVVFVGAPSGLLTTMYADLAVAAADANDEVAEQLRAGARQAAEEMGLPVTFVVRQGDPFAQLRDTADQFKADMLVVGTSAQAGHRFLGSVATRLVRLGRWPVVVVP
ncbi:universal stress protein A [Catellatospora sp. TT07R-123]|uniref:universal stress protein n=1 Tax=Catellatospora sp. TT07R-123 TaxID=2733863 RepID=UPI001B16150C|nr:universal stress protein [Catellatospora sp. TT07R-123]GHJ44232.1 universal stress protein A [Catellatospora sp. TT07R-123]